MGEREENFIEWLNNVLFTAQIYDYRYPVKGMGIWMPYGYKLRQNVINIMRKLLDKTGHEEVLFPLLIPRTMLEREATHIKGFMGEVFWVTRGGKSRLDMELALRPTSETSMTTAFRDWIQSWKDLPLKVYQVVSVFRYETKSTRPLIRVREISTFKEAFTAHATSEDAWRQFREAISIYKRFFNALGIPYIISSRLPWDRFAGADETVTFDTIMPDGRALQIGSVHYLGQRFSKAFDAKFMTEKGKYEHIYQLSYGISERVIASIIAVHSDELGPILPPNVAPIQVVIVPIPYKEVEEAVYKYARRIYDELKRRRLRVHLDDDPEETPGSKFYKWERRGVPLRVEVGPRDLENGGATLVRRDTRERLFVKLEQLAEEIRRTMRVMLREMKERAWREFKARLKPAKSLEEIGEVVKNRMIAIVPWCGSEECAHEIEDLTGYKILGKPLRKPRKSRDKCPVCGRSSITILYVGRSY